MTKNWKIISALYSHFWSNLRIHKTSHLLEDIFGLKASRFKSRPLSVLFSICIIEIVMRKEKNKQKEAGIGPFLKNTLFHSKFSFARRMLIELPVMLQERSKKWENRIWNFRFSLAYLLPPSQKQNPLCLFVCETEDRQRERERERERLFQNLK